MRTWYTDGVRPVQLTENMENALVEALADGMGVVRGRQAKALRDRDLAVQVAGWTVLTEDGRELAKRIKAQREDTALEGEPTPMPEMPEYRPTPEITAQDRADTDRYQQDKAWRGRHGVIVPEQVAGAVDADHAEALAMNEPQIRGEVTTAADLKESADRVERLARVLRKALMPFAGEFSDSDPVMQEHWREVARAAIAEIEGPAVSESRLKFGDLVRVGKSPAMYRVVKIEGDAVQVRVVSGAFAATPEHWYASWMVRRA